MHYAQLWSNNQNRHTERTEQRCRFDHYNFSFLMHEYEQYFIFTGGRKFNFQTKVTFCGFIIQPGCFGGKVLGLKLTLKTSTVLHEFTFI